MKELVVAFCVTLFLSQSMIAQSHVFDIQGHRGCRGLLPENTIPAFKKAIELGVTTLEMDVVVSKDNKIVVSHEPFFNPDISSKPDGKPVAKETEYNLYQMDYKTIRQFDVGKRGNPRFPLQKKMKCCKPLLSDVLRTCIRLKKDIHFNIEIKSDKAEYGVSQPSPKEFSELVYNTILPFIERKNITIQSFDFEVLQFWHHQIQNRAFKPVLLAALIEPEDNNDIDYNLEKLGFIPDIWSPHYAILTQRHVKRLHEMGMLVIPWTVNDLDAMKNIIKIGCDGLISDYPDIFKRL